MGVAIERVIGISNMIKYIGEDVGVGSSMTENKWMSLLDVSAAELKP
jgi:hypothetical protein